MKDLVLVGLSHKSAPISVREKVAFSGDALRDALVALTPEAPGLTTYAVTPSRGGDTRVEL